MLVDKNKIIEGDSAQFDLVLSTHFLSANENTEARLNSQEKRHLADCLSSLLKNTYEWVPGKSEQLISALEKKSGLTLNPIERAEFKFNVIALDDFYEVSKLDTPLSALLGQCRYHLLINSLTEKQFLLSSHPLKQLVDFIHDNLLGFDAQFGKALMPIYQFVENLIRELLQTPWNDVTQYKQLILKADRELKQLTERFFRVSDRMVTAEVGQLKVQQAQELVSQFMQSMINEVLLPEDVASCVQTHIANELKIVIATEGKDSPYWLRAKKLLQMLINLYQPDIISDSKTHKLWRELPDELSGLFSELKIHNPQIEKCLDTVKFDFYQRIHEKPLVDLKPAKWLGETSHQQISLSAIDDDFINKVESFNEGQWFLYKTNDQIQRVYLSLKLADYNQYLFINMLGQKTISLDLQTFASELSAGCFIPLNKNGVCIQLYSVAVDKLLKDFYERYENQRKARQQAEDIARLQLIEQEKLLVLTEEKTAKIERERQAQAVQKIRQEVPVKQVEQERQDQQEKQEAKPETVEKKSAEIAKVIKSQPAYETPGKTQPAPLKEDVTKRTRLLLDSLSLGSKIDLLVNPGKTIRAKLAVRLVATKRFIFIDHDGLTVLDALRGELIDRVLAGSVVLLDADDRFNEKLKRVVQSIQASKNA